MTASVMHSERRAGGTADESHCGMSLVCHGPGRRGPRSAQIGRDQFSSVRCRFLLNKISGHVLPYTDSRGEGFPLLIHRVSDREGMEWGNLE